jgi:hypothetical protein
VAFVDDVEEHVGGIRSVGEVTDFVDHQDAGLQVAGESLVEFAARGRDGQFIDEGRCGSEQRGESVLDGAVGDGDRQVGFPTPAFAEKDQVSTLADEFWAEVAAQQLESETGLEGEVEIFDRLEEGKVRLTYGPLQPRLLPLPDLLGHQGDKEVSAGPSFGLRPLHETLPVSAGVGEVQPLEHGVQIQGLRVEVVSSLLG